MNKFNRKLAVFRSIKGSTPVIIVCIMLIVVLISAVIADIGYAAFENYRLNKNAERTAAYGAARLIHKQENVKGVVRIFAIKNISGLNELDIRISNDLKEITVNIEKPFSYYFLNLFGFQKKQIKAKCTARISNISSVIGVRPFAIEKSKITFGKDIILTNKKANAGSIQIAPISLGEGNYKANIVYGYRKTLNVGDGIYSLQGNIQKNTIDGFTSLFSKKNNNHGDSIKNELNENQIIFIPVVDKLELTGKETMNIIGFSVFYVKDFKTDKDSINLKGIFLRRVIDSNTSDKVEDFGLNGIRLIHWYN